MKLKNKKTGVIGELNFESNKEYHFTVVTEDPSDVCIYKSLDKLGEEWEDYKEPKDYWWISPVDTDVVHCVEDAKDEMDQYNKEVGNYFETRVEAEKAVEKLKAWKRLKDKGFRFVGRTIRDLTITYSFDNYDEPDIPQMNKDLDLLFGGEE